MNWKFKTFKNAQVVSYYNQAINVDAPHPAAARLWEEYLYSADAQNDWFKGGANPVLLDSMKKDAPSTRPPSRTPSPSTAIR